MKIMDLNVWQGRLERVLLKHLETLNIDIACMQEAVDYNSWSIGLVTSLYKIKDSLNMDNVFFSPLFSSKLGKNDISFGNVIYSKYPFNKKETNFIRGEYKPNFDFDNDNHNIKAFQHAIIKIENKTLHVINHHGHHIDSHKLGDAETMRQVLLIKDYISHLKGPVILCGDFNLEPKSDSIKVLNKDLRNLSVEYNLKTTRSKLTYKNEVCDYIFVNDEIILNDFFMDKEIISDHNALILDFDIK